MPGADRTRRWWVLGLAAALIAGAVFRLIWGLDIEYKYDEAWTFERAHAAGRTEPFPAVGMGTSAGFANPGLSIWVFIGLDRLFGVEDPADLARAVQLLNVVALALLVVLVLRVVPAEEREPWLWAAALVALNPIAVLFQRKIWPPSVVPILTLLLLFAWLRRERRWGAFLFAAVGLLIGQIHIAGVFFLAALTGWALLFDRKSVRWGWWLGGCAAAALPLIPWAFVLLTDPPARGVTTTAAVHLFELKFWLRWITEPFGLSIDYALGEDFADFLSHPLVGGRPTYLIGALHGLLYAALALVLLRSLGSLWQRRGEAAALAVGRGSPTAFTLGAAVWGFGLLLTLSLVPVVRHYLWVAYPLGFVWLARLALVWRGSGATAPRLGRATLLALCVVQGAITAGFLGYVRGNERHVFGDFGTPYRVQVAQDNVMRDVPVKLEGKWPPLDWPHGMGLDRRYLGRLTLDKIGKVSQVGRR